MLHKIVHDNEQTLNLLYNSVCGWFIDLPNHQIFSKFQCRDELVIEYDFGSAMFTCKRIK